MLWKEFAVWNDVKMSQTPSITFGQQKERRTPATADWILNLLPSTVHCRICGFYRSHRPQMFTLKRLLSHLLLVFTCTSLISRPAFDSTLISIGLSPPPTIMSLFIITPCHHPIHPYDHLLPPNVYFSSKLSKVFFLSTVAWRMAII